MIKKIMSKVKSLKRTEILYIIVMSALAFIALRFISNFLKKENYSSMGGLYGGLGYDAGSNYVNPSLYKEDIGAIGTRKDFANMRKPLLNPIFVPVVKGETE